MNKSAGVTLVEVLIATVILSVIIALLLSFTNTVVDASNVYNQVTTMEQTGNEIIELMVESLRSARIQNLPAEGDSQISFQVPVDQDSDGDVFDSNFDIEWGVEREDYSPGSVAGVAMRYEFVKTSEFSETERGVDINGNGTMTDVFDVGHIVAVYESGTGISQGGSVTLNEYSKVLTGDYILLVKAQAVGDVNGDGQDDPIFWQDGTCINATLFLADVNEAEPIMVRVSTAIPLLNM